MRQVSHEATLALSLKLPLLGASFISNRGTAGISGQISSVGHHVFAKQTDRKYLFNRAVSIGQVP
jgi:hypothetical protein